MARFRPLSAEVASPTTSGTAITVSDANVVRVVNTASSTAYIVTLIDADDNLVGSMTLVGQEVVFVDKPKGWKLYSANSAVKFTSVSYPV